MIKDPRLQLSAAEFKNNLRMRLLLPPKNTMSLGTSFDCSCTSDRLVAGMDDHHALSCHLHSGLRTVRHNQVVDALADFLIAAFPTATVSKEHALSNTGERGRVTDIYLASGPSTYIIDVSVVNTGGKSYIDFGSAEFPGVAGNKRAADKRTLYSQLNLTNVVIIPFVIEAAGRWSKEATTFLQTTCGVQLPSALTAYQLMLRKKTLRRRINCVIAKTNSVIWPRFCGDITPAGAGSLSSRAEATPGTTVPQNPSD